MLRMLTPNCMLLAHHECCLPIDARHRSEHHRCDRLRVRIRSDDHAKHGGITDARCSRAVAGGRVPASSSSQAMMLLRSDPMLVHRLASRVDH